MSRPPLPNVFMPFPPAGSNPHAPQAEAAMWAWLETCGLLPTEAARLRVERTRPALMYAQWCPTAEPDVLALLTQYLAWAFMVDDEFDIRSPDPARCIATVTALDLVFDPHRRAAGSDPLVDAFADLWRRLSLGRSEGWRKAFRSEVRAWLWTYYREAVGHLTGHLPDIDAYRSHRRDGVALYMFMDISEIASGVDLPESVRQLAAFRDLRDAAEEHMGLYNDICSLDSDERVGYRYNAALLLQDNQDLTREQAVDAVNDMLTACLQRFHTAMEQLPIQMETAGIQGQTYADAVRTAEDYARYVRANFDYHQQTPRYSSAPEVALEGMLGLHALDEQ